jgi:hypothetical protein
MTAGNTEMASFWGVCYGVRYVTIDTSLLSKCGCYTFENSQNCSQLFLSSFPNSILKAMGNMSALAVVPYAE